MKISLLIPHGFTDKRRHEIFLWTTTRWMRQFPDFQICYGHDDPQNYNRSRARNKAFKQSDGDILILTDSDTATTAHNVLDAIELCQRTSAWVIAHRLYYSLDKEYTDFLLRSDPECIINANAFNSNWVMKERSEAGVIVLPREAWTTVEGYDEEFKGWGYEDNAFAAKLTQKWSDPLRTTGTVAHLWHDPGENFQQPHIEHNRSLLEEIKQR